MGKTSTAKLKQNADYYKQNKKRINNYRRRKYHHDKFIKTEMSGVKIIQAVQETTLQIAPCKKIDDPGFAELNRGKRTTITEYESDKAYNSPGRYTQKATNIIYTGRQFSGTGTFLKIKSDEDADIIIETNKMMPKKTSEVLVRRLPKDDIDVASFLFNAPDLSEKIDWMKGGHCRKCPEGEMVSLGVKVGAGRHELAENWYTKHDIKGINKVHKSMNVSANKIAFRYFNKTHREIKKWNRIKQIKIPQKLGGKQGLSPDMVVSCNLGNEAHVDLDFARRCFSIWSLGHGTKKDPKGWYFVLPYLSCDYEGKQYKGIVVELSEGCGIEWDGRWIFHSSTSPLKDDVVVNGNFFGVTRF